MVAWAHPNLMSRLHPWGHLPPLRVVPNFGTFERCKLHDDHADFGDYGPICLIRYSHSGVTRLGQEIESGSPQKSSLACIGDLYFTWNEGVLK